MKHSFFKKLATLMLALCLLVSIPVISAQANTGLIDPDQKATLTVHKYYMDELPDPGDPATGEANNPQLPEGATPLENITFIITRVNDDATDPATAIAADGEKAYTETAVTNPDGEALFSNGGTGLPHGVYLVQEQESAGVNQPVADFLVSVPMTNTAGNGWIYDVHVYPKNVLNTVTIDKFVTDLANKHDTAGAGDTVTWLITAPTPADIGGVNATFTLTDNLHEAVTYTADTFDVYTLDQDGTKVTLTPGDDFTVEFDNGTLTVTLTATGREKLADVIPAADDITAPVDYVPTIYMEYDTTFTSKYTDHLGAAIAGELTLDYVNNHKVALQATVANEPEVHLAGLKIKKIEANSTTLLDGAKFKLYLTRDDAMAGTNAVKDPSNKANDWEVTTVDGYATFYGLAYGSKGEAIADAPETTYWLVETQAPMYDSDNDGTADKYYNLLKEPVEVKADNTSHTADIVVQNNKGFTLPITGGTGTIIFSIIGILFIGGAVLLIFYSVKKRKR